MDYKDYASGLRANNFWFYRKTEFIGILLEKLKLNKNIKILNIGAGTGNDIETIKKFGQISVLDIDKKVLDLIPNNLVKEKVIADACNLPFDNNSFDLVVSFDVLEHIKNDNQAVLEIKRVLKFNGLFVFTVPAYNFLFSSHDRYLEHFRRYNKKQIQKLLNSFDKIELGNWFFTLFLPISVHRLINKNNNYKLIKISKITDFFGNKILKLENLLFKYGIKYPIGLSFYGIYKKKNN